MVMKKLIMLLSASFLLCVSSVGANYAQQINLTSGEEDVVLKTKKNKGDLDPADGNQKSIICSTNDNCPNTSCGNDSCENKGTCTNSSCSNGVCKNTSCPDITTSTKSKSIISNFSGLIL